LAPWLAPQSFIPLYTSRKGPPGWVRGTNQCVGQVGSVRSSRVLCTASGRSTVQPSATCSTGPRPSTRLRRDIVQGIPPRVRNPEENPPPRKYPVTAGYQDVASRHRSTPSGVT